MTTEIQEIQLVINSAGLPGYLVGAASMDYFSLEEVQGLSERGFDCIADGDAGVVIVMEL